MSNHRRNLLSSQVHEPAKPRQRTSHTPAQKAEYRRVTYGLPSPLDNWIACSLDFASEPLAGDGFCAGNFLVQDYVTCTVKVVKVEGEIEELFQDPHTFTLYLTVHLHPSSGFLVYYWTSPTVILASYTGTGNELNAPDWVTLVSNPRSFRQPQTHIIELLMIFAAQLENERLSRRVLAWCFAVSRPSYTHLWRSPSLTSSWSASPRNLRSHKTRASALTYEQSQERRLLLNQSPSWTSTARRRQM
ncbi:uncharacterized protein LACBIDRAFT_310030 [Laccaria bicolor S238N-H82]|uniref:Predicted protein n=1 Tax=Laccaria bicolor (strain S238N-H82 / ATCC MYA-4686) TaxID=486041 RepID=B0DTH7_LACBS|nr:uncharacterized protein LACBIDRAFT_310030 [Laccaria bicolor S238N-H82]EDR02114.1 predicted protein [Laccaria bicolor S238N-H82]|eukprot:XP_001887271.1 predicted protein [Laccaria bicolor S238N-H82]